MMLPTSDLPADTDRCRTAGVHAHIRKPVRLADLVRAIHKAADPSARSRTVPAPEPRAVVSRGRVPALGGHRGAQAPETAASHSRHVESGR